VLKQADVVLADFLLGNEFAPELKRANFEYYDPITTGDSSLSACVQSIMAAEIGADATALEHFLHALFMDLADLAGNTTDGVHMASAGGVWMALVYGFGGLRDHGGRITIDPRLPKEWARLRFRLAIRSSRLTVEVEPRLARLLVSGEPLEVIVRGETIELFPDAPVTCHW
jgi:alpha,alpha-trehalose phosphorylase